MSESYIKCLTCPVAHRFIAIYNDFYNSYNSGDGKHVIPYRKLNLILESLGNNKITAKDMSKIYYTEAKWIEENPNEYCANNLKSIISCVREFMYDSEDFECSLDEIGKHGEKILIEMERILKNIGIYPLGNEDKLQPKISDEAYHGDIEKAEEIYRNFTEVFLAYTENLNKITYERCGKIHANNPLFADIKFDDLEECFKKPVRIIKKPVRLNECPIPYDKLTEQNIVILESFLEKSPKKFSHIFKNVLEYYVKDKQISTTDISILYCGDSSKKGLFNNYLISKNDKTECDTNKNDKTKCDKKILSKILLVSEDVLTCGIGKIYGSWKIALNENKNKLFQYGDDDNGITGVLTKNDIEEYNAKETSTHKRISMLTREKIFENIKKLISQNDEDFYSMIRDNPDFFFEEDFCAYIYEENDLLYYDYQEIYNQMLEPKSFDVLLSVLLELQESEKAEDEENNSVTPQEWLDIVRKQINN